MSETRSLLDELNESVSRGTPERRLKALWHATDRLITGSYSEDQIWLFGEVIERLAGEIEVAARAQLSQQMARAGNAPINVVGRLASDPSIEVAGPVLAQSERLDVRTLVATCKNSSQQHLLAISKRKSITPAVTDVLVTRGDSDVVRSVASNQGAKFSEFGFLHLIKRSEGDSILAEHLGLRSDIPRQLFQQLISKASAEARSKLEQQNPQAAARINTVVADVTGAMQSKFGPATKSYFEAKKTVVALHRSGGLREQRICEYAQAHKFEETAVALSLLCGLPVDVVERALTDSNNEMILVLAKTLNLSWTTAMALLFLCSDDHRMSAGELEETRRAFERLSIETSRDVLNLYQSRKESAAEAANLRRLPQLRAV